MRFETFLAEHRARLTAGLVASYGPEAGQEAAAEAMAYGWQHWERLQAMDNPVGYLYRVGLTRTAARKRPELPPADHIGMPTIEPDLIPALLALPESQRAAVWLVHACGWTYGETAEALKIGRSTVGTHVSRAMTALRKRMEITVHG